MSAQEMSFEQLARLFDQYRKALDAATESPLGPDQKSWKAVASEQLLRMEAEARVALRELGLSPETEPDDRRYYAKPGQAEWGC